MYFSCTVPDSYEGSHCKIQSTGTAVHIPYSQSSAGDPRVQPYCCTVPDFPCPFYESADLIVPV